MNRLMMILALAALVPAFSCASDSDRAPRRAAPSETSRRETGGGLWSMLDDERRRKEQRFAADADRRDRLGDELARGREQVPAEQRRSMEIWWRQFVTLDPGWVQSRHEWRALGGDAVEILVENLLIAMVRAYESNKGELYKRAQAELYELHDVSTPYLVSGLSEARGDDFTRRHCIEVLGLIGRPALPELTSAYRDARDVRARLDVLRAISAMGESSAPDGTPFLSEVALDEDDFRLRIASIQALGRSRDRDGIPALLRCLDDDDVSVRKFAAASLGGFSGDDRVVDGLVDCLAASERRYGLDDAEREVGENCVRSLGRVTGRRFTRAADWKAWRRR